MTRKQWLETFIGLAVSGAPALEYRKRLRLKTNVLGIHVKKLGKYQEELAGINANEAALAAKKKHSADMARARVALAKARAEKATRAKLTSETSGSLPPATKSPEPEED